MYKKRSPVVRQERIGGSCVRVVRERRAYLLGSCEAAPLVQEVLLIDDEDGAVVVKIERALHFVGGDDVGAVSRFGPGIKWLFAVRWTGKWRIR